MRKAIFCELTFLFGLASAACVPSGERTAHQSPAPVAFATPGPTAAPLLLGGSAIVPNPMLTRAKRVVGHSKVPYSDVHLALDGDPDTAWTAGRPTPTDPAWLAIDVGTGPARLLLFWGASGSYNYEETDYGSPGAYRIETSADSTDGSGGTWTAVTEVPQVLTHCGVHTVPFVGQRWVRLVVTGVPPVSPNGVQIDEVSVHDATASMDDTWFFMGDSITALAFGRMAKDGARFASIVHARHPRYFPVVLNGGVGSTKSGDGANRVDDWMARNPDVHFWAIEFGTNDAAGNERDTTTFRKNLQTIVDHLRSANHVPILATIPFANDGQHADLPAFNAVIEEIRSEFGLPRGPDLYAWFLAHPEELRDGLHPNDKGIESMNRLWADAADALYPR